MRSPHDTALELPHTHAHEAMLTVGCPGCIRRVKVDQALNELRVMPLDELIDESSLEGPPVTWRNRCADQVLHEVHGWFKP